MTEEKVLVEQKHSEQEQEQAQVEEVVEKAESFDRVNQPPYAGYRGSDATVKAIESYFFWPGLRVEVDAFC